MDKVWLVVGSSHDYEDSREWNYCACESESQANSIADKLNEELKLTKEKNKLNLEKCNEICDEIEDEDGKFCECNCDDCEWQFNYNIDEEHGYHVSEVDFCGEEK